MKGAPGLICLDGGGVAGEGWRDEEGEEKVEIVAVAGVFDGVLASRTAPGKTS